ncbi:hypothetical protein LS73_009005 [Helicobacter muridarum]|uniref:VWA domain protein interacting with AAA ATPase n=1 Tax=Helicobacter muridarum TaxID=216 RepID=A0A377PT46_9HELI|nr:VWA domain-containing protein [Helicobacter muridarum]TLD98395.1 hypothetical protein LS73_009005 [Helicobacter muridarum]STQ85805.1 VWA domain protein interacting with AAA ATPase [Helicobacter muridarum]
MDLQSLDKSFTKDDLAMVFNYDLQEDTLNLKSSLEANIIQYNKELESSLKQEPKNLKAEKSDYYRNKLYLNAEIKEDYLHNLTKSAKRYNDDFDEDFYAQKIKELDSKTYNETVEVKDKALESKIQKTLDALYLNALNTWKKKITQKEMDFRNKTISNAKNKLINRVKEWVELIKKMNERLKNMGEYGNMFKDSIMECLRSGLESGKSLKKYVDENELLRINHDGGVSIEERLDNLANWTEILKSDSIKKLCDMLGRLSKDEKKMELENFTINHTYNAIIPTPYTKYEISEVILGKDLENILPQELALLDDEDFSILFDMKFSENRLFCFEKQGHNTALQIEKTTKEIIQKKEKEEETEKGPIILCVDTSGSMHGLPEQIAKSITIFMAKRAEEQKRKCFLIHFSDKVEMLDLTSPNGIFELMNFLSMSFSGGTDSFNALKAGIAKMKDEDYKKADLLLISDFIFGFGDEVIIKNLLDSKDKENKYYALYATSNIQRTSHIFDGEFLYDTSTHNVRALNLKAKEIFDKICQN